MEVDYFNRISAEIDAGLYSPESSVATVVDKASSAERERKLTHLERFTTLDLLENSPRPTWLIEGVLVDQQPGGILGSFKTLKTSIGVDAAFSIATGTPFLRHFNVPEARRVGMISGESGRHTLSLLLQRIADAADIDPYTQLGNLVWSTEIPRLDKAIDLERLRTFIKEDALEVVCCDPMYLLLGGAAKDASNIFAMGEVLAALAQVGQDTGCTVLLIHHTSRGASRQRGFDPPELGDSAFSGTAEFLRQWISLGRRSQYDPDSGCHELWMSVGGSAGQSGLFALDIDEGHLGSDFSGRRWDVSVMHSSEARQEQAEADRQVKQKKLDERLALDKKAVVNAFGKFKEGETKSVVKDRAGLGGTRFNAALKELLEDGEVVAIDIVKGNARTYEGYKLAAE